jgi:hypothetical protein
MTAIRMPISTMGRADIGAVDVDCALENFKSEMTDQGHRSVLLQRYSKLVEGIRKYSVRMVRSPVTKAKVPINNRIGVFWFRLCKVGLASIYQWTLRHILNNCILS